MEQLVASLVAFVQAQGGSVTWDELISSVDFADRQKVPRAIAIAKANGQLEKKLIYDPETGLQPLRVQVPSQT